MTNFVVDHLTVSQFIVQFPKILYHKAVKQDVHDYFEATHGVSTGCFLDPRMYRSSRSKTCLLNNQHLYLLSLLIMVLLATLLFRQRIIEET